MREAKARISGSSWHSPEKGVSSGRSAPADRLKVEFFATRTLLSLLSTVTYSPSLAVRTATRRARRSTSYMCAKLRRTLPLCRVDRLCGIVPVVRSSGDCEDFGPITRQRRSEPLAAVAKNILYIWIYADFSRVLSNKRGNWT